MSNPFLACRLFSLAQLKQVMEMPLHNTPMTTVHKNPQSNLYRLLCRTNLFSFVYHEVLSAHHCWPWEVTQHHIHTFSSSTALFWLLQTFCPLCCVATYVTYREMNLLQWRQTYLQWWHWWKASNTENGTLSTRAKHHQFEKSLSAETFLAPSLIISQHSCLKS